MEPLPEQEDPVFLPRTAEPTGELLPQYLGRTGRLPVLQGLALVVQLLAVLERAHAVGQCHGGLAPDCVLVERTGVVQLRAAGPGSAPLPYIAPELVEGGAAGVQADLYAAAMLAYEVLAGTLPFGPATGRPAWPPRAARAELPAAVDAVFRRALAQDPAFRHGSAQELSHALQAAIGAPDWNHSEAKVAAVRAQPVRPPAVAPAVHRPPRRRGALVACAVAAAASFVVTATALQLRADAVSAARESAGTTLIAPATMEPLKEEVVIEEAAAPPTAVVPMPASTGTVEPSRPAEPAGFHAVEPEPVPAAKKPARPARDRTIVRVAATRVQATSAASPQSQCHGPSATAREMCLALTCGTEAFRAHPTCVRLYDQAQAQIRLAEQRGGS